MPQFSIFFRTLQELHPPLLKWGAGLTIYTLVITWMIPLVAKPAVFSRFSEFFGASSFLAQEATLHSTEYWLVTFSFVFVLPLILSIFMVWTGGGMVAKSEENGELTLWLAQPISRRQITFQKYGALLVLTLALTVLICALMLISNWLLKSKLSPHTLIIGCLSSGLTALTHGSLAFLLSVVKGRTTPSRLIGMAIMVLMYLLFIFPPLPSALRLLSPFTINASLSPLNPQASAWRLLTLFVVNVLLYLASQISFERRDLNI